MPRASGLSLWGGAFEIGADEREIRLGHGPVELGEAEIELVISKRSRVISHRVHRRDHRVRAVCEGGIAIAPDLRDRRALQEIAAIEEKAVGDLGACLRDFGRKSGKPCMGRGPVGKIVVGAQLAVEVRGFKKPQRKRRTTQISILPGCPVRSLPHLLPLVAVCRDRALTEIGQHSSSQPKVEVCTSLVAKLRATLIFSFARAGCLYVDCALASPSVL